MIQVLKIFGAFNVLKNITSHVLLSLFHCLNIMNIFFSLFNKVNSLSLYVLCSAVCAKLTVYIDEVFKSIIARFNMLKTFAYILIKWGMMKPVLLVFNLYGMVLKNFIYLLKRFRVYGKVNPFFGYLVENWKMTTLPSVVSAFVSGDTKYLVSFLHPRTLLGLVATSIIRVSSLPFVLMVMASKLLFNVSCKIGIYGLKMSFEKVVNGWERMVRGSSIYEKLDMQLREAKKKLEETEKDLRSKLERANRRAEDETKRRRNALDHSAAQIRQVHKQLAIVEEDLRSKSAQIKDLENRLFEDKPNECWRKWAVKREEVIEEMETNPYRR